MRVLMIMQRGWARRIGDYLAHRIRAEHPEARFAATVSKADGLEAVQKSDIEFEHVWPVSNVYDTTDDDPDPATFAEIAEACGLESVWSLMPADRHLYYNYAASYYYALERNGTDDRIRRVTSRRFRIIQDVFDRFDPDLIVGPNFVSPFHLMLHGYAHTRGVSMVGVVDTKVRGVYAANTDPYASLPQIVDAYQAYQEGAHNPHAADARAYIDEFRERFIAPDYLPAHASKAGISWARVGYQVARSVGRAAKNVRRRRHDPLWVQSVTNMDNAPLRLMIRDTMARKRYMDQMRRYRFDAPRDDERAMLFPLQLQPEAMQDVVAPTFVDQVALVRQLAMGMPGDMTLYVKEHPGCVGYRGRRFYDRIRAIPNVKLIHPYRTGHEILRRVDGVVSLNGTIAFENALDGRPSILMGKVGGFSVLPHIYKHTDVTQLPALVADVVARDHGTPAHEQALVSYVSAVLECGERVDYTGIWERGADADKDRIYRLYRPYVQAAADGHTAPEARLDAPLAA